MKILNPQVLSDIEAGKALNLNLGGGAQDRPGYYSLDLVELAGVDIVADLNAPLQMLPDNCAKSVFSRHALEHVVNFLPLMEEIHRITRDSGTIELAFLINASNLSLEESLIEASFGKTYMKEGSVVFSTRGK